MQKNKGYENLIPITERTKEERKAIASKGGYAKAEKQKQRKMIKETFDAILDLTYEDDLSVELDAISTDAYDICRVPLKLGLQGQTVRTRLCARIVTKALRGDLKAAETILRYVEPRE